MNDWKEFFKGKRVTVMGLGLLGRGLGDMLFLAECGAELIVTDLRDEKTLAPSLAKLKKFKNIRYTLGGHKLQDFRNRDFVLKAAGVPLDSPYVAEARRHGVPVEMDASLFAKLMPKGVTLVGVTGTRGKSTVTALIYEILSSSPPFQRGSTESARGRGSVQRIFKGGNLVPEATLPLLKKVKSGDIVVLELDSWQLQGFHDAKLSPQVAVFTTFLDDHLLYYKGDTDRYFEDKIAIFKYQKAGDLLIAGERVAGNIGKSEVPVNGDFVIAKKEDVPLGWNIQIPGEHNLENIACALAVAKHFKIPEGAVKKAVESFKAVSGRLEFIREVRGIKIYNDNNATTPDATIAALCALSCHSRESGNPEKDSPKALAALGQNQHKIVLILGGTDKGLDMSKLVAEIPKHCKAVVFLKETGTEKLLSEIPLNKGGAESARRRVVSPLKKGAPHSDAGRVVFVLKETLKECVEEAMKLAEKGDIVLFSPAFASFGKWFKNEYDRGEQFVELIKRL